MLFTNIPKEKILVGVKQTKKALKENQAQKIVVASDVQSHVISPILELCSHDNVLVEYAESMEKLGKAVKIDVGAAVVTILK